MWHLRAQIQTLQGKEAIYSFAVYGKALTSQEHVNARFDARARVTFSSLTCDWVVYCEKDEDLAIIAVRNKAVVSKFKAIFDEVRATSLNIYIERPDSGPFPKIPLKDQWKSEMIKNYSTR